MLGYLFIRWSVGVVLALYMLYGEGKLIENISMQGLDGHFPIAAC